MKFKLGCGKKQIREYLQKNKWTTNGRHKPYELWKCKNTNWMTLDEARLYIWALHREENKDKYLSKRPLNVDILSIKRRTT